MIIAKFGDRHQGMEIALLQKLREIYKQRKQTEYIKDMLCRIDQRLAEVEKW